MIKSGCVGIFSGKGGNIATGIVTVNCSTGDSQASCVSMKVRHISLKNLVTSNDHSDCRGRAVQVVPAENVEEWPLNARSRKLMMATQIIPSSFHRRPSRASTQTHSVLVNVGFQRRLTGQKTHFGLGKKKEFFTTSSDIELKFRLLGTLRGYLS